MSRGSPHVRDICIYIRVFQDILYENMESFLINLSDDDTMFNISTTEIFILDDEGKYRAKCILAASKYLISCHYH